MWNEFDETLGSSKNFEVGVNNLLLNRGAYNMRSTSLVSESPILFQTILSAMPEVKY